MDQIILQSNHSPSGDQQVLGSLFYINNEPALRKIASGKVGSLSPLLGKIVIRTCNSTHALAKKHNLSQNFISYVLHGRKKSKRVEGIIQAEWGISVAEFQSVTRDWLERKSQGRGYSEKEIKEFSEFVRARRLGISVEELRDRRNQTLGGLV